MKTIKIFTFGCKVNQYDSQIFRELFLKKGYAIVDSDAYDIAFINSCCVTIKAQNECRRIARKLLREGKRVWISGCWVEKDDFNNDFPGVVVLRRHLLYQQAYRKGISSISGFYAHNRAFIKVVDGCENFCSYCIVPFVRGKVKSRPIYEIVEEIKNLTEKSVCEVVLTGINLGSYGIDIGTSLKDLIKVISEIPGLKRLRLSSIEALYVDDGLLEALSLCKCFCPCFHIPLQSGSSSVLAAMNRPYNYQVYKDCIDKIYSIWSNATITTDIMIGFPTETEVDFLQTLSAIEECGFLKVHIFPFSLHKQTSAAKLKNNVSLKEKKLRMLKAIQVSNSVSTKIKSQFIGRTLSVFIEENINGLWSGYSENYIPNLIYSDMDLQGRIVSVIPEKLMDNNKQISLFSKKISILP